MFYVEQICEYLHMKRSLFAYSKGKFLTAAIHYASAHKQRLAFSLLNISFLIVMAAVFMGCERPMDNPESVDRIYNDLNQESKTVQSGINTEKKALEEVEKDIASTKSGDNNIKVKFRKKYESEAKVQGLTQRLQYINLRALSRKEYVGHVYPKYFEKKMSWPDDQEWKDYQASKRLSSASRDWNHRVPQLGKHIKEYNTKAQAEFHTGTEKKEAKKEGEQKDEKEKKPSEAEPKKE